MLRAYDLAITTIILVITIFSSILQVVENDRFFEQISVLARETKARGAVTAAIRQIHSRFILN